MSRQWSDGPGAPGGGRPDHSQAGGAGGGNRPAQQAQSGAGPAAGVAADFVQPWPPRRAAPTYAALDLGTNNCRLLIARPSHDGFRIVDAFSRIVRLGEGLSHTGRLSEAAIRRTLGALAVCRDKMAARGVSRSRLIATEACRAADNGAEFSRAGRRGAWRRA